MRRTEAEAQETRKAILQAAQQVFFERGVCRASLEEVAKTAGVSRGAVYWHFRNKADLFETIHQEACMPLQDVLQRLLEAEGDGGLQKLEDFCTESFLSLHQDEDLRRLFTVILLKCEASGEMESLWEHLRRSTEETVASVEAIFDRLRKSGDIGHGCNPRLLAFALHSYMTGLFIDYLRSPSTYRMPADARALVGHFFSSIRAAEAEPAVSGGAF